MLLHRMVTLGVPTQSRGHGTTRDISPRRIERRFPAGYNATDDRGHTAGLRVVFACPTNRAVLPAPFPSLPNRS